MRKKKELPCLSCEWWKPLSVASVGFCCHCLLETGKRNGMNDAKTKCTTWEERKGNSKKPRLIY